MIVAAEPAADVAAVAIVRCGEVLAGQRRHPAHLAGGWELPGGKRRAGETLAAAAVREIAEELSCRIRVRGWLPVAPVACGSALTMAVAVAELVDGSPSAVEHAALRWLGPESVEELDWLEPDRPFLPALAEVLLDGERLPGGHAGGAVRVGDTVRKQAGAWTPAVRSLLTHLDDAGLRGVPRSLGPDARGRDILTYLPGQVLDPDSATPDDAQLAAVGRWISQFHKAVSSYRPPAGHVWRSGAAPTLPAGWIICHNDLGCYNVAFDGAQVGGVFDWDMAGPGRPVDDIAFCAWSSVPLFRGDDPVEAARRLTILADSYGIDAASLLAAVPPRITASIERIRAGQRRGDPGLVALAQVGEPRRTMQRLRRLVARVDAIAAQLD